MPNRILQKIDSRIEQMMNSLPVDRQLPADYLKREADALKDEFGISNLHNYSTWQGLYLARPERESGEMTRPLAIVKQAGLHLALFIAAVVVLSESRMDCSSADESADGCALCLGRHSVDY